jgi:hypothetical protein
MANIQEAIEYSKKNPSSSFANELKKRIESGQMNNELKAAGLTQYLTPEKETLGSKLTERAKTIASEVTGAPARKIVAEAQPGEEPLAAAEVITRTAQAPIRAAGEVGGALGDVLGAGLEATGLDEKIGSVISPIVQSEPIQKAIDVYKTLPQETQDVLASIFNAANIPLAGVGASGAKTVAEAGVSAAAKGAKTVAEAPIVKGAIDVTKMAGESLARVPSRVATNVAEKQAQEAVIKSLPTPKAQVAARDGVDITDITTLPEVAASSQAKKLVQTVKDFAQGKTKVDPIEIVGEPIIKRVKDLDTQRKTIGAQLGEVSKNLGVVTKPELSSGVFARLIEVPGLQGLTVSPTGKLNFAKTTLTSKATAPDRKALQEAYSQATRWGDGEKAHLYRQELFEILGGKKKGRAEVTDTQEGGLDAIRSGLSDVLESKNGQYKTLSNEYRKIVQPLGDLRKLMKNIDPNSTDDILNMSAGLLARRITSAAASNPQIKQLLQNLDEAGVKGTTKESVTQLQDLYNILNKYYDIAPKTGFQNLTKEATADSLVGTIKETARDIAGKSNAVRQKALEDYLDELLTETR